MANRILFARGAAVAAMAAAIPMPSAVAQSNGNYIIGGDARAFAMGGAGIATLQQRGNGTGSRSNPASLTYEKGAFGFNMPSVGFRGEGFDGDRISNFITNGTKRGDATGVAQQFIQDLIRDDASASLNGNVSVRIGKVEVGGFAVGRARLLPNARLRQWASESRDLDALPTQYADSRLDLIAAGYYTLPSVAFATTLPVPKTNPYNFGIGARAKAMTAYYTHYVANAYALSNAAFVPEGQPGEAFLASEMNGKQSLRKTGLGIDVGFLARPRNDQGFSYAAVIANLLNPGFKFHGTDRDGNAVDYDILKTTLTTGAAYEYKATTVALDWADMTGATGNTQIRLGAEQRLGKSLAVRGGFSTAGGATYGFGFFGLDVAFGRRIPLEVVKTINF